MAQNGPRTQLTKLFVCECCGDSLWEGQQQQAHTDALWTHFAPICVDGGAGGH